MSDIFNRNTDFFGGSFAADQGFVTFPRLLDGANAVGADVGLLIQRLAMSYQQQVTRLYEVGRPAIYYIGGRTTGNAGIDRVVGPRSIANAFYQTYGDICQARSNSLDFTITNGCGETGTPQSGTNFGLGFVSYVAHFVIITTVGVNVAAADMIINESVQMMFSSLLYTTSA